MFSLQWYWVEKQWLHKAFDTADWAIALKDLQTICDLGKLHLIKVMLNTESTLQCDTEESNFFKTDTDVPQRVDFSAIDLTWYVLRELWKENNNQICKEPMTTTSSKLPSTSRYNHCQDIDEPCDMLMIFLPL